MLPELNVEGTRGEIVREIRNGEMAIGGRQAMRRVVLLPGAEYSTTGVSLTALTKRVHIHAVIPPGWK
jgi:hypothetical protein